MQKRFDEIIRKVRYFENLIRELVSEYLKCIIFIFIVKGYY